MSGLVGFLNNPVRIVAGADAPNAKEWQFDNLGNIRLPRGGNILNSNGDSVLAVAANSGNFVFDNDILRNTVEGNSINFETRDNASTVYSWKLTDNGETLFPNDTLDCGNNNLNISSTGSISIKEWTFDDVGNLVLPTGSDIVDSNGDLVYARSLNDLSDVNLSDPIPLGYVLKYNGSFWEPSVDANVNLGNILFVNNTITNVSVNTDINIETNDLVTGYQWNFSSDGKLTLPENGEIKQNFSIIKTSTSDILNPTSSSVIWSSSDIFTSSAKLLILVEQDPGDSTPDNSQTCEAIISAKGAGGISTDLPVISIYGITYTSLSAIATFTVQRNLTTKLIEVVATLTNTNDPAYFRIHSTELLSRG